MLSGPLPQQETAKLATESFGFADVDPLVDQIKTRWGIELYTSHSLQRIRNVQGKYGELTRHIRC